MGCFSLTADTVPLGTEPLRGPASSFSSLLRGMGCFSLTAALSWPCTACARPRRNNTEAIAAQRRSAMLIGLASFQIRLITIIAFVHERGHTLHLGRRRQPADG